LSILLGIELAGEFAGLTILDRRARVVAQIEEPLVGSSATWYRVHPEERVRAVFHLIGRAVEEGILRPAEVAGIGICADPGLVLIDNDWQPVPPRAVGWSDIEAEEVGELPVNLLERTLKDRPELARELAVVFDTLDYLRYRLTGAVATTVHFSWHNKLCAGAHAVNRWNAEALRAMGLDLRQMPPIFPCSQRVGIISEEVVKQTGISRGTWVSSGSYQLPARLWLATEPSAGAKLVEVTESGARSWRVTEAGEEGNSNEQWPAPHGGCWYHLDGPCPDPRREPGGSPEVVHDIPARMAIVGWEKEESLIVSADSGLLSTAPALLGGLALGWWRDSRPIWRKLRPPLTLAAQRERQLAQEE